MFLLPKVAAPPVTCDDVRPLSILPMFRRMFETLILPAFTNPSLDYCKLHPSQAGFRRGYSTLTQATVCHHAIQSGEIQFVIFLDFKSAYDVTLSSKVLEALQKRKIPPRLQSLVLSSMFTDASYQLVVNDFLSESIPRDRGLPQGSPLSPIIFNLFIDPLVAELNRSNRSNIPRCLFYADDGALFAWDLDTARTLLRIAERWAADNGMIYNVAKSGVLSLGSEDVQLTLDGRVIPVVLSYKYLGFPMTSKGIDFLQHRNNIVNSTEAFLRFLVANGTDWSPAIRSAIFSTFVQPQMEYGAPLLLAYADFQSCQSDFYHPLQLLQDQALAWIFCTNSNHLRIFRGILGALPISERFSHLRCRYQFHLDNTFEQNPLRLILAAGVGTLNKFVSQFHRYSLYDRFKRSQFYLQDKHGTQQSLSQSLDRYLLSLRLNYISTIQRRSKLLSYITPHARLPGLKDKVFKAPSSFQIDFLAWRRGAKFLFFRCVCGDRWNRRHVKCLPAVLPVELEEDFQKEKHEIGPGFQRLDFLLNHGQWDLAHTIIQHWSKLMTPEPWYISLLSIIN